MVFISLHLFFYFFQKKDIQKLIYLLEGIKMLQVNVIMIYINHKISVSFKDKIFKRFFKECNRLLIFFQKNLLIFFTTCNDEKFKA